MAFFFLFFWEKRFDSWHTGTSAFSLITVFCSLNNLFSFTLRTWKEFELHLLPESLSTYLLLLLPFLSLKVNNIFHYLLALLWEAGRPTFQPHSWCYWASASHSLHLGLKLSIFQVPVRASYNPLLIDWGFGLLVRGPDGQTPASVPLNHLRFHCLSLGNFDHFFY